jgi:two-component system, OmpR family, phosphate regulon sensor histidine kinase PhoR
MFTAIFITAILGLITGASGCYAWRENITKQQLQQVLAVMETTEYHEDISLPLMSQLRRRALMIQQQRQQLQQQLFGWQSILQEAPIGYLQIDTDNQVLWCNQSAQNLLQIQKWHSNQTRLLLELVRSYELNRLIEKTRSSQIVKELVWQFHFGYQETPDSRSIWLKASSIPLENGAIGVFIESQQEQIDAKTSQERWLSDLAHEIRTPLTSINLLAETLESKVSPDLTRWANRILQETNRLIDLVQHFVELSQLETASNQYLQITAVDLTQLVNDAWYTLELAAKQRQIEFIYTGPKQLVMKIDPARFTQVSINLFDNSLKYCPDRGHIWVDIHLVEVDQGRDQLLDHPRSSSSSQVVIDLYDDGAGFDQADLPYIFDRLYRGDVSRQRQSSNSNSNNSQTTGSGLGLAIVRQIILAHHGTIVARNHPTTGGAWFQITLPNS